MKDPWTVNWNAIGAIVAIVALVFTVGIAWNQLNSRVSALEDWGPILKDLQDRVTTLEAQTHAQAPDPLVERCLDLA